MTCPKGYLCFEQYTILFIGVIFFFLNYYFYITPINKKITLQPYQINDIHPIMRQGNVYTTEPKDTLLNPYAPPLQYNEPHKYKQIGYLKSETHDKKLFPLFGKPIHHRRDKWYYYTIYDNIKVPIFVNNRDCSTETGCDSLNNGDPINIEGMNDLFLTSLYKNNTLSYTPDF